MKVPFPSKSPISETKRSHLWRKLRELYESKAAHEKYIDFANGLGVDTNQAEGIAIDFFRGWGMIEWTGHLNYDWKTGEFSEKDTEEK